MRPIAVLPLCLAACLAAAEPSATALIASGERLAGTVRIADGEIAIGGKSAAIDELIALRLSAEPPPRWIDQGIALIDGDVLAGVVRELQKDKLVIDTDRFGRLTLPAARVAAVALAPQPLAAFPGTAAAGAALVNGDEIPGTLAWLDGEKAGIDTGRRIAQVARRNVALARLRRAGPPAPEAPARQHVRLITGDRLSGSLRRLDAGKLELADTVAGTVTIPVALVASAWSEGGRLLPLAALAPASSRYVPEFAESFPPAIDRLADGGFLVLASGVVDRCLVCRGRSELIYDLPADAQALVVEVVAEPRATRASPLTIQAGAEGATVDLGPASAEAKPVIVPLAGAKRLRLATMVGDGGEPFVGAAWCWPVVVRARAQR